MTKRKEINLKSMVERREIDFLRSLVYFTEAKNVVEVGVQFGDVGKHLAKVAQENGGTYLGFDLWNIHGQANQFEQMGSLESVSEAIRENGVTKFELIKLDTIAEKEKFEEILDDRFKDGIDFAFIDGDHSYLGIANDFSVVYPRLKPRGVVAFHDTAVIDGCREFVYHLRKKYNDGTFDIIDFPFGSNVRHCGLSILSKKSYPVDSENIHIDEVCGSLSNPAFIEDQENKQYEFDKPDLKVYPYLKDLPSMESIREKMITDGIGHYPERKKYE